MGGLSFLWPLLLCHPICFERWTACDGWEGEIADGKEVENKRG